MRQRKISFDLGGNRTHDLRIRSTVNRPRLSLSDLVAQSGTINGRSNPEVVDSIPTEVKRNFSLPRVVP